MEIETRIIELLKRLGIRRNQTVLDFGCGYGTFTIPVARIVGKYGKVYALDKDGEALSTLMKKAMLAGLTNIERMETSGIPEVELADATIDGALLFDVFHSYYFPEIEDRKKLLAEIHRVMKPYAFLAISVWPNLLEPEIEDEINGANFDLEKEVTITLTDACKNPEMRRILNFGKEQRIPALAVQNSQASLTPYENRKES